VYQVAHGQGSTTISHRHGDWEFTLCWCVDTQSAVKHTTITLHNHGSRTAHLRLVAVTQWQMGASRADRGTVFTEQCDSQDRAQRVTTLLATQRECSAGLGGGTAFLSHVRVLNDPVYSKLQDAVDWTCDRRECFDERGRMVLPDQWAHAQGLGLDPCAALGVDLHVAPGTQAQQVFVLGYAASPQAARALAMQAGTVAPAQRLGDVRRYWDQLLGATTVRTPDALFNALVNRWLLYQTVACRLWAKAGFYQAGGATGFRDQLQDAMALAWAAPQVLRQHIVVCAGRQFAQGDVQHWWHTPSGAGVRTHFSDDLLWLPYACVHYVRATGDTALWDTQVAFLGGPTVAPGAEDAYFEPTTSAEHASVYEHAARTLDRSLAVGDHGLPLMGTGDWNDGMNRVGHAGRGESVWLGWFLCLLVEQMVPIARERGELARVQAWSQAALGWRAALLGTAWDGEWFKRAYFDDGQALGSHANAEASIDLIAQAWSVLSGVAPPLMQQQAMDAVQKHLVNNDAGLIQLLAPPLAHSQPSAGYIQAYPPGVRENGGQYSHAGVWAVMAAAALAVRAKEQASSNGNAPVLIADYADPERAFRYFTYLSPAHRSHSLRWGGVYGLEPYAVAGDVYSQTPYVGRGGWSWYTGAAAWLHRAAVESIFGLQCSALVLCFKPCLPSHWPRAEISLTREGRTLHFLLVQANAEQAMQTEPLATLLMPGQALMWQAVGAHSKWVIPLQT
jgi:cyclic beta-1,2-glucan synthetase